MGVRWAGWGFMLTISSFKDCRPFMSVMFSGARLSVLDLAPINEGSTVTQALDNAATLAAHVEQLGYQRYWMAEHHNMPGIASSATAVALAHVASRTSTIRVGAGGVMLPNHAPLVIAEQFGTLAALHPGRIDLGLGRAPGTDQTTAQALRRTLNQSVDSFPQDVMELQAYFGEVQPGQRVQAVPGANSEVPLWILGSSLYGAQLAAALGLPYAFASHFAPAAMQQAIDIYRSQFKPSAQLDKPYFMLGFNICAAETEEKAHLMRSSSLQALVRMRRGMPGQLPPPIENYEANLTAEDRYLMQQFTSCSAVGTAEQVSEELTKFVAQTQPNEIMVVSQVFDQQDRLESFRIVADLAAKTESATSATMNPAMAAPSAG